MVKKQVSRRVMRRALVSLLGLSLVGTSLGACQFGPSPVGWPFGQLSRQHSQQQTGQAKVYTGKIELQFDPGLLGSQYQGLPKVAFGKQFRIQSEEPLFDQMDQVIQDKADQLNAAGHGHCVYQPPANPQNGNCNSTSTGLQCSGALDKTISTAQCPEIAVYGGAVNINHDLSDSKLFVASANNLTLNRSVQGIFSTRGDLNVSINNQTQLNGVFVGARSNNFNMSDNARLDGLFAILNQGSLAMNLNPSSVFEGQLCTTGQSHLNIQSQLIYSPDRVTAWQGDLAMLNALMCEVGTIPYTQILGPGSPTPTPVPTPTPSASPSVVPTPTPTPEPSPGEVVFDPADPNSLGDLYPSVPGNNPDATVPETQTTLLALNDQPPAEFKTGQLAISPSEPAQQNLQTILQTYNAQLANPTPIGGFYLIQVDLNTVNLDNLLNNLHQMNLSQTNPDFVTHSASFANLESAKTFALVAELIVSGLVDGVDFDHTLTTAEGIKTVESPELQTSVHPDMVAKAENSWWLNDRSTRVTRAWNYALGYNRQQQRPVKVAVIDQGFAGAHEASQPGKDLDGQILWNEGKRITYAVRNLGGFWSYVNQQEDWTTENIEQESIKRIQDGLTQENLYIVPVSSHGTRVASTIVSQVNDGEGIAGIAPQAKIVPYKLGDGQNMSWWDLMYALLDVRQKADIDVVNLSLWSGDAVSIYMKDWSIFNLAALSSNNLSEEDVKTTVFSLASMINDLNAQGVIVIACAGNGGWDIARNYPAGPHVPGLISVGAVEPINTNSTPEESLNRAVFFRAGSDNHRTNFLYPPESVSQSASISAYASNWDEVDIWAPGNNMLAVGAQDGGEEDTPHSSDEEHEIIFKAGNAGKPVFWNGTSAAAPVIAGIAALAKSFNPSITSSEFKQLLHNTAHTRQYTDQYLRSFPSTQNGVECGGIPNTNCGTQLPNTFLTLQIANAEALLQSMSAPAAQLFTGTINPDNNCRFTMGAETLDLYWGGSNDNNLIGRLHYEDLGQNPSEHKPLSELSSNDQVEVMGWRQGNRLYFNQIRKTPVLQPKQWRLHVFNINDQAEVLINGVPVQLGSTGSTLITNTGSGFTDVDRHALGIDITDMLSNATNLIEFRVANWDQNVPFFNLPFAYAGNSSVGQSIAVDNSSSWGFELYADNQIVYRDIRGNAANNRVDTSYFSQPGLPQFGARRGSFAQGPVLHESIRINKDGSIPIESGPYLLTIYNVSDISQAVINGQSFTLNAQSPFDTAYDITDLIQPHNNQLEFRVLGANHTPTETWPNAISSFTQNSPGFPLHNLGQLNAHLDHQRQTYTWGFDLRRNGELIYRNRDGEREAMDVGPGIITNHYFSFPAGARFNTRTQSIGGTILNDQHQF